MKIQIILITLLSFALNLNAQTAQLSKIADVKYNGDWIKLHPEVQIAPEQFFGQYKTAFDLRDQDHFELVKVDEDELGFSHYRYQQYYKGHPIEGAEYILHAKEGAVRHGNGKIVRGVNVPSVAMLNGEQGIEAAQQHMGAEKYYWEIPEMENRIKYIKKDPDATFYPSPELVVIDPLFQTNGIDHKLAWKVDLYAEGRHGRKIIFIDATSGDFLFELEGCHSGSVEGIAETRYHGTQTIITDSVSPTEYRLIDATRGGGVETYDLNTETDDSLAVDFIDDDNYWDNVNAEMDDAATDTHWGMEMTYDYYYQKYGRDSYDDNGSPIISYVHYNGNWSNAQWTGMWAQFGDGSNNPWVTIDIVSHELTHGVTGNSAGLIYANESGALNESFSDIFGTAVEHFAWPSQADWLMGQQDFIIRDLSNPNDFGDPDTYEGTNWYNGNADNGGVHTNSGVQNFWFYLLSTGGAGTNDNGNFYAVDSLGIEKAGAIAYRNLNSYLTASSNYFDARLGSLQAAEDLYGTCSDEVIQVMNAWYAVGVGLDTITHDAHALEVLSPISSCGLTNNEIMTFSFRYNRTGCGHSLEAGDTIKLGYQIDNTPQVFENLVLTEDLNGGDIIAYTFQAPGDLSDPGVSLVDYWVDLDGDQLFQNNAINNFRISNAVWLNTDDVITFEYGVSYDSFYIETQLHSEASITLAAANTGNRGVQLNGFGATLDNTEPVQSEEDNFVLNPNFRSKMCTCVDATDWDHALLSFDLRQTFSEWYLENLGADYNFGIALRVLVDGEQIGEQFHPTTYDDDPYLTHLMDLDQYAGTQFNLCFEGVHFIRANEDPIPGSPGDQSYLDNIFLSDMSIVGIDELQQTKAEFFPNPTTGELIVEMNVRGNQDVSVVDVLGREVLQQVWIANGDQLIMDLSDLARGLYTVSIKSTSVNVVELVLVE